VNDSIPYSPDSLFRYFYTDSMRKVFVKDQLAIILFRYVPTTIIIIFSNCRAKFARGIVQIYIYIGCLINILIN
jgi:hypothetical protein